LHADFCTGEPDFVPDDSSAGCHEEHAMRGYGANPLQRPRRERGQAAIEFTAVLLLLVMAIFGVIETGRMMLAYIALADGARAGVRYAIVHGSYSTSPSGYSDTSLVQAQVTNITGGAGLSGVKVQAV